MSISTPTPPPEAANEFVNSRPFEWLARAGFVARGLVYGIIGLLALKLAIGSGGKTTDQEGAMSTLAHQPLGRTMLVAAGGRPRGLRDVAVHPRRARPWAGGIGRGFDRIAALASGLVYAAFFVLAIKILLDANGGRPGARRPPPPAFSAGPPARSWSGWRAWSSSASPATRPTGASPEPSSTTRRPRRCGPR